MPKVVGRGEQARHDAAVTQISMFGTALDAFEVDNGYYPRGRNGLNDLVVPPRDATNWKGPYMKEVPLDPWLHPYIYEFPGKHGGAGSYDLYSAGPDGRQGSDDDVTNWQKQGK